MRKPALLLALFLAIPAYGQIVSQAAQRSAVVGNPSQGERARNARKISEESIEIAGATLRLGMTKAEVSAKLVGSDILKVEADDLWLLKPGGESVAFSKGVLVFADRGWTSGVSDAVQALFGVSSLFNQEGLKFCTLYADTVTDPGYSSQRVFIVCGKKSILVYRMQGERKHLRESKSV
jgi:hypothetical protein